MGLLLVSSTFREVQGPAGQLPSILLGQAGVHEP
jgi:hypothetical protein